MNLAIWLHRRAAFEGEAPALFDGKQLLSDYAGFADQAARIAGDLQAKGVAPGDRVAIFAENTPAFLPALFGIWWAGAAAVPINAKLHGREVAWIVQNAGACLVFASKAKIDEVREAGVAVPVIDIDRAGNALLTDAPALIEPRDRNDLAWLFYTSGTTGRPKGVIITHGMLQAMALSYFSDVDQVVAEDAALYSAPLSHGAGLYSLMHVLKGARHVFPASRGFDEAEVLALARHHGRVHMFAAPTMVKRLTHVARQSADPGTGLRTIVYAGGPMYLADIIEAVDHFGDIFVQIYGQGECPMAITVLPRADVADRSRPDWKDRLASVGYAQSAVEVRIGDADGAPVPAGTTGEIMVRGAPVMPGYWRAPEATAAALRDGWLRTGDIGHMNAQGYLTLVDRSKDMIISGGSNIYPREVEELLLQHPSVLEASVVGRPHAEWGEEVVAFVVCDGPLDSAALDRHCLAGIARFKRPKAYVATDALPKNNYGKVLKTQLRAQLSDASASQSR
ncbi:MAG: AMP-binding protein [Pseudomonadota bacterium]